jgi:hypothetical protein
MGVHAMAEIVFKRADFEQEIGKGLQKETRE